MRRMKINLDSGSRFLMLDPFAMFFSRETGLLSGYY